MAAEIPEFVQVLEDSFEELSQQGESKSKVAAGEKTWNSERPCLDRQDRKAGVGCRMRRKEAVRSRCPLVRDALGARRFWAPADCCGRAASTQPALGVLASGSCPAPALPPEATVPES